ncbi:MAG TPA: MarR family winged helix-turn-helix transcriptional regulator [Gryllotalpicola sp.]
MPAAEWDETATLWFLVRQAAARMDRAGDALYRQELGVSLAQFLVLSVVDAHPGPLNQQVIVDRLGLTKGTVSRQIELAVESGRMTVETSPHSRREHIVRLTPEGTALVRRGDAVLAKSLESDMPAFDPVELAATIRTLTALNAALGGAPSPQWARAKAETARPDPNANQEADGPPRDTR